MVIKALGLDFFGTLVEAEADRDTCVSKMCDRLRECGYAIDDEDFASHYRSTATEHRRTREADLREVNNCVWISDALRRMGYEAEPSSLNVVSTVEAYFDQWRITLYPDALSFLKLIRGRYTIALVSNFTDSAFLHRSLSRLGIDGFFDFVVDSDVIGWRKPHPTIFKRFLELSAVKAGEVLFVGDDLKADVRGAKDMGIRAVFLARPGRKLDPGGDSGIQPDFVVSSLTELGKLLDEGL